MSLRERLDWAVPWMLVVMLMFIGATELFQLAMPRNKYFHAYEIIQWLYVGLAIDHALFKGELSVTIDKKIGGPHLTIIIGVLLGVLIAW